MKFSEQWLREWVDPDLTTEQLAQQMTNAGLEVDAVAAVAGEFSQVLVGRILSTKPHPQADKLTLCTVDIAASEPLAIVCGAGNVRENLRVAVATVGARLPHGMTIKSAKLRGEPSAGMLCSAGELGLADESEGILALPDDAPIGADIRQYLSLDDNCIDVDLTPNRGDCFSIAGIARDVAALNALPYQPAAITTIAQQIDDEIPITIHDYTACGQYVGRIIRGFDAQAQTPLWLAERLRRSGTRTIHPIVDIANYVMLELGQPMHAFDLAKINGGINVRRATAGESLQLLDEQTIKLQTNSLVIADDQQPLALAGIMGGLDSAVGEATQSVLLESAYFAPAAVMGVARSYNLATDSAQRFERGVDPDLQVRAIERATQLMIEILGGQPGPVLCVNNPADRPQRPTVTLRASKLMSLLGLSLPAAEVTRILQALGMQVTVQEEGWQVIVPTHRFDITMEADLIEEVGRIHGYDKIAAQPLQSYLQSQPAKESTVTKEQFSQRLIERGYREMISYSFIHPQWQQAVDKEHTALALLNPISPELSVMRTSLWPGLLRTVQYNQHRQMANMRLFEMGLVFIGAEQQIQRIAGVISGQRQADQWNATARPVDFYDIKADVEALLVLTGESDQFRFIAEKTHPSLHPGKSAGIFKGEQCVGWLGEIHPALAQELELQTPLALFELDRAFLSQMRLPEFEQFSKFPIIRRDLSLLIDAKMPAQAVIDCVQTQADSLLRQVEIFDVYTGKGVPVDKKSIAIALFLQHEERNLQDEEIQAFMNTVITILQQTLDIELRE